MGSAAFGARVRAARPLTGFVLNRYPGVVIGVALYVRGRGLSFLWGRPGAVVELTAPAGEEIPTDG